MEETGRRHKREKEQKLARERALVILRVRTGAFTAKEGAKRLGVSRKTYYEWEERALKAMCCFANYFDRTILIKLMLADYFKGSR